MLIPGFPNYDMDETTFEITNVKTGHVKIFTFNATSGYWMCQLYFNNKGRNRTKAAWMAHCFIPNPENKPTVDHINRIRTDDRIENLRWATHAEQNANQKVSTKDRKLRNDNVSGTKGISWDENAQKWKANIQIYVGGFVTIDEAKSALISRKRQLGIE